MEDNEVDSDLPLAPMKLTPFNIMKAAVMQVLLDEKTELPLDAPDLQQKVKFVLQDRKLEMNKLLVDLGK
jgi:hypothetical protein